MKNKKILAYPILLIIIFLLILLTPRFSKKTADYPCLIPKQKLTQNYSFSLEIIVNGQNETVPAGIGIQEDCLKPIHTLVNSGKILVKVQDNTAYTVKDLFAIWEKPLERPGFKFNAEIDGTELSSVKKVSSIPLKNNVMLRLLYNKR